MAMTSAVDTRLLLTLEFPPDNITRDKVRSFVQKELVNGMIFPSIVLSEFLKIAASKIGIQGAIRTINVLKERGAKVKSIDEELALEAGRLLLKHRNVPFADSLVAAFVSIGTVDYILSDDPHFTALGTRTKWL
jgi:predicted nucleic acid-binding protein